MNKQQANIKLQFNYSLNYSINIKTIGYAYNSKANTLLVILLNHFINRYIKYQCRRCNFILVKQYRSQLKDFVINICNKVSYSRNGRLNWHITNIVFERAIRIFLIKLIEDIEPILNHMLTIPLINPFNCILLIF